MRKLYEAEWAKSELQQRLKEKEQTPLGALSRTASVGSIPFVTHRGKGAFSETEFGLSAIRSPKGRGTNLNGSTTEVFDEASEELNSDRVHRWGHVKTEYNIVTNAPINFLFGVNNSWLLEGGTVIIFISMNMFLWWCRVCSEFRYLELEFWKYRSKRYPYINWYKNMSTPHSTTSGQNLWSIASLSMAGKYNHIPNVWEKMLGSTANRGSRQLGQKVSVIWKEAMCIEENESGWVDNEVTVW